MRRKGRVNVTEKVGNCRICCVSPSSLTVDLKRKRKDAAQSCFRRRDRYPLYLFFHRLMDIFVTFTCYFELFLNPLVRGSKRRNQDEEKGHFEYLGSLVESLWIKISNNLIFLFVRYTQIVVTAFESIGEKIEEVTRIKQQSNTVNH